MSEPHNHSKKLGTKYGREFSRPEDIQGQREREAWREQLGEIIDAGPRPHPGMQAAEDAFAEAVGGATEVVNGDSLVGNAVLAAAEQARKNVELAQMSPEDRLAKAIARELKGQVLETDAGDVYIPLDDDVPTDAEIATLVAEVEDEALDDEETDTEYERFEG